MKGGGHQHKASVWSVLLLGSRSAVVGIGARIGAFFGSAQKSPQLSSRGYTIVEVMIFMAVTGALFAMIAVTFSGRQAEAEFSTATREMESRLQDVINDVSTGYYLNNGGFTCRNSGGAPAFTGITTAQGKNDDCIFIGRVAQFDLNTGNTAYNVYTAAGVRQILSGGSSRDVQDLTEARPRLIAQPDSPVDVIDAQQLPVGLEFANMYYVNGAARTRIQAIGFFGTFATYAGGGVIPGTISVDVLPIVAGGNTQGAVVAGVRALNGSSFKNPSDGVYICFNSTGLNKYVELKIGGGGRQLSTDLFTRDGRCPAV